MKKKILGIGNALVDILVNVEDIFLINQNLQKGSMQLVEKERVSEILKELEHLPIQYASGGSAANTIYGLSCLGASTGYIGKIGNDPLGNYFASDLLKQNINPILLKSSTPTGTALTLITPDSERTFATYLGAALELNSSDLQADFFSNYDLIHLEGYLVYNHELIEKAIDLALQFKMEISVDLASYNIVEANREFLNKIICHSNIVFANEQEAKALTHLEPEAAVEQMAQMCQVAVVKVGAKGSWIMTHGKKYFIEPYTVNAIDSTGAGDLYAAGFLYGYANDWPLETCGKLGSLTASKVIQVIGAKISSQHWEEINTLKTSMI